MEVIPSITFNLKKNHTLRIAADCSCYLFIMLPTLKPDPHLYKTMLPILEPLQLEDHNSISKYRSMPQLLLFPLWSPKNVSLFQQEDL